MSHRFMDTGQTVGYDFTDGAKPTLIVTLEDKMAEKMKADGWHISHDGELGHFVTIILQE